MDRVNRDELIRRYAAGERNFSGVNLEGDLSGIDLSGADFSGNKLLSKRNQKYLKDINKTKENRNYT
ncbi:pentapeptide repeat-containing protein [Nostoc sp.]|uniref:pentapeptide repeat-containing protein n=1 Tax=Nostoc sp. TaxID=1180 RepID=UPI002FF8588B